MTNQDKKRKGKWTRRAFIGTSGLLGTGLVVGVGGYAWLSNKVKKYSGEGFGPGTSMNAWLRIAPDNTVTIAVPRAEMGQGVYTSLPQLVAEELEVEMSKIKVIHPQPEAPYSNTFVMTKDIPNAYTGYTLMEKVYASLPLIVTGGSTSIADAWDDMRYAGATARELLIKEAAGRWGVSAADCSAEQGQVINIHTRERINYGDLAEAAAKLDHDQLPTLKKKADFKVIGTSVPRLDIPPKVDGSAEFGLDVRLDGMLYAAIKHPSSIGGKITKVTNEDEVLDISGVRRVILTDLGTVAVVADHTYAAMTGVSFLEVDEEQPHASISTEEISKKMLQLLDDAPLATPVDRGEVDGIFAKDDGIVVEGTYSVPYLAHCTMEPMNCTVQVTEDHCTAWVGHQATSVVQDLLAKGSGLSKDQVTVHITYLGGGFGRRAEADFVKQAVAVANAMKGTPIQTVYTREEDMRNDMYRPASTCRFRAKVNEAGDILAWDNMAALQSVNYSAMMRVMPSMAKPPKKDEATSEGLSDLPYEMPHQRMAFGNMELPIQVGFWRSVGYSQNTFFAESFMDECAHAAGVDPYQFRKSKLEKHPRWTAVLDRVAEMSNWSQPAGANRYRGIAIAESFGSIVGQVAEIEQQDDHTFKIHKYYCVIDCGNVVNPDTVQAQLEGGIVFGLTAAIHDEITWQDGGVVQSNFPNYEMLRMAASPSVEVHIMDVDDVPGGVGEPGVPPSAPALANAIYAATGHRLRDLPLTKSGYKFV